MSQFTGTQYRGAMRDLRAAKRDEANARNALTTPQRKSLKNPANTQADINAHSFPAA